MNRRAIVAGILALLPLHARAQRGIENFPLAPQPNPNTTCADLFSRKAGEIQPNLRSSGLAAQQPACQNCLRCGQRVAGHASPDWIVG
jgi:hypothetical protein